MTCVVSKVVLSISMELTIYELTFINIAFELKLAVASLLTINKIARVFDLVVLPLLRALAMVHVVQPLTIVHRTVLIYENSVATCFAFLPLAMINVTILMGYSSFSMKETFFGHSLIFGPIRELNEPETFPS